MSFMNRANSNVVLIRDMLQTYAGYRVVGSGIGMYIA